MRSRLAKRVEAIEKRSKGYGLRFIPKLDGETNEQAIDRYCRENDVPDNERCASDWFPMTDVDEAI